MNEDTSDLTLLCAWQAGDAVAGNHLVRRYYHRVRHFFATKVDDHIDDLTQQTFTACVQKAACIIDGRFAAYLFGIARNKLLHRLRHQRRHGARLDPLRTSVAACGYSSGFAARDQRSRCLLLALHRLPIDAQIALEMFYWEEMSIPEIAVVLDVPVGTVKARLFRARRELRGHLAALTGTEASRRVQASGLRQWAQQLRGGALPEPVA
ncbi:MAG: sigma-70 family RNA polymerase sigma factor [Deltaproteobacteria bacterium]|nr:sigma-70 family RNA polymerase sigma factor [Deltaproteobacteria bacterium]